MSERKKIKWILIFLLAAGLTAALAASGAFALLLQQFNRLTDNYTDEEKLKVEVVFDGGSDSLERQYVVRPGEREDFAPKIVVTSQVDAYIFAEMTDTTGEELIIYKIADGWEPLPPYYNGQFKRVRPYYRLVRADDEIKEFDLIKENEITYSPRITAENVSVITAEGSFIGIKAQGIEYEPFSEDPDGNTPAQAYAYLKFDNSVIAATDAIVTAPEDIATDGETGAVTLSRPIELTAYAPDNSAVLAKAFLPEGTVLKGDGSEPLQFVVRIDDDCSNLEAGGYKFDVGVYGVSEDNTEPVRFELYSLPDGMTAAGASYWDAPLTDAGDGYSGEAGTYAFDGSEKELDLAAMDVTPAWALPEKEPVIEPSEKFVTVFPNTDKYIYRVGNLNDVKLLYLFDQIEDAQIDGENVTVSVEPLVGNADGSFTPANSDVWKDGKVGFSGTGLLKVSITDNADDCVPTELLLEVVDGKNITSYSERDFSKNNVLLHDIKLSSGARHDLEGITLYGNGYEFDITEGNSYLIGIITLNNNCTLDNIIIKGMVYENYTGSYNTEGYSSAVNIKGKNNRIVECRISNCSSPLRVSGDVIVEDSVLYGGTFANIEIGAGTLTIRDVTTVNQSDINGRAALGIVANCSDDSAKLVLEGQLKQYNYFSQEDANAAGNSYITSISSRIFSNSYSDYHFIENGTKYINAGIVSINSKFNQNNITDNRADADSYGDFTVTVLFEQGYAYTRKSAGAVIPHDYAETKPEKQGNIIPKFDVRLGSQEISYEGEDDDRYCYYSDNVLKVLYMEGSEPVSINVRELAEVTKYNIPLDADISVKKGETGVSLADDILTLNETGEYTIEYIVEDDLFFDLEGSQTDEKTIQYKYSIPVSVSVKTSDINAEIYVDPAVNVEILYGNYSGDYKYAVAIFDGVTITDYNAGRAETLNIMENVSSVSTTGGIDANLPINVTFNYDDGRILTCKVTRFNPGTGNSQGDNVTIKQYNNKIWLYTVGATNNRNNNVPVTISEYTFRGYNGAEVKAEVERNATYNTSSTSTVNNSSFKDFPDTGGGGGGSNPCFTSDTLITLADGTQKRIDQLAYDDKLKVYDFFTGEFTERYLAAYVDHGMDFYDVCNLVFSDGTKLKIVIEHELFDYDLNKFVNIDTDNCYDYIGHTFVKYDGDSGYNTVKLTMAYVTREYTGSYSVFTADTYNAIAEQILTMTPNVDIMGWIEMKDKLLYDTEKFNADVEKYGIYSYEELSDYVTREEYEAFHSGYFKIPIEKGLLDYDELVELTERFREFYLQ